MFRLHRANIIAFSWSGRKTVQKLNPEISRNLKTYYSWNHCV